MFQKIWGVIFFLALSPAAWAYDFEADGIYYTILSSDDKTVEVTTSPNYDYRGDVVIPETVTYEGTEYRVIAIGERAFLYCDKLTSVTIPESVTSIGEWAFSGCSGLKEVHISDLDAWWHIEFDGYSTNPLYYAHNLYLNDSPVTELTIPEDITTIDNRFQYCTSITSVTIPESVTTIKGSAFSECSELQYFNGKWASSDNRCLVVNDTLEAFAPSGLSEYTIPNEVKVIGDRAFYGCYDLTSVTIPNGVTSIGDEAFWECSGLMSVTIPESVTSIGNRAFVYCYGLTEFKGKFASDYGRCLIVNDTLKAFAFNSGLSEYTIPNEVKVIGDRAFELCVKLTSVTIPNGVTSIGDYAFYHCEGLTSVTIPENVTSIGREAFVDCFYLEKVYISDLAAWCRIDFKDPYGSNPLFYDHNLYLDNTLVTDLKIPDGVTEIYPNTFSGCRGLTSVTIPESVTTIGDYAFSYCESLTSVTIGNSVTAIGNWAFENCTGLTSVTAYNPIPVNLVNEYEEDIAFLGVDCSKCTLYVPAESVGKYKAAAGWVKFGKILPIDESSAITEIQQDKADEHVTVYNLQGVLVLETDDAADLKTLQNGAYIVNGKKMIIAR